MRHSVSRNDILFIENIPPQGLRVELEAAESERAAIAQRLGAPGVVRLKGAFEVARTLQGVDVAGSIDAIVKRECGASLEIFEETIDERFELRFVRGGPASQGAEIEIGEETPEPLEGETLDLGEILIQQLSLSMDPYPRKPGAASLAEAFAAESKVSPFADLKAALEKRERKSGSDDNPNG